MTASLQRGDNVAKGRQALVDGLTKYRWQIQRLWTERDRNRSRPAMPTTCVLAQYACTVCLRSANPHLCLTKLCSSDFRFINTLAAGQIHQMQRGCDTDTITHTSHTHAHNRMTPAACSIECSRSCCPRTVGLPQRGFNIISARDRTPCEPRHPACKVQGLSTLCTSNSDSSAFRKPHVWLSSSPADARWQLSWWQTGQFQVHCVGCCTWSQQVVH